MNTCLVAFLAFLLCYESVSAIGRSQSIAVQGRLICKGAPSKGTKVKLYDKGTLWGSNLGEINTNANGEFRISGSTNEFSRIDPTINIYHKCDHIGPCYRKFTIEIPKSFITKSKTPNEVYDIGILNLQNKLPKESKDCIN